MINWVFLNLQKPYKILYFTYKKITDRSEINWINNYLKEGMTAVDIGANIGSYALILSKKVGNSGRVIAFEPDENNFKFLKKNVKNNKNIFIYKLAVGNKNSSIKLYISKNWNVDHHTYKDSEDRIEKTIKSITLDNFLKKDKKIDFIKIDIQGFDYFAIKGAKEIIKRQKHIAIVGEFWPYGLTQAGVNPRDYYELLKNLNLKIELEKKALDKSMESNKKYYTNFIAYK